MTDTRDSFDMNDSIEKVIADLKKLATLIEPVRFVMIIHAMADRLTALQSTEWQPIENAPAMKSVFIHYKNARGNSRIIKAKFIPKYTLEAGENTEDEYDEANDRYTCKEGWYESIDNWDDFSCVFVYQGTPDSWMPLPKAIDNAQATVK